MRITEALPSSIEHEGGRLLDLAMWCLGRDVQHRSGNVLLRHGCQREALPNDEAGTSAYSSALPHGGTLTLWGFGALVRPSSANSGVFFDRGIFRPRLVDLAPLRWPLFRTSDLGELRVPTDALGILMARTGGAELAGWLADYEAWITGELGSAYRSALLNSRTKRPPCSAEALSATWAQLAHRIRSLIHQPLFPLN